MKKSPIVYSTRLAQIKPRRATLEMRNGARTEIRHSDGISGELTLNDKKFPVRIWDVTSLGACVIIDEPIDIAPKQIVMLRLNFSWGESVLSEYEVRWTTPSEKGMKVGLKIGPSREGLQVDMAADEPMIEIASNFPVMGYLFKEIYYQERSIFRLVRLSSRYLMIDVMDQEHLFLPQQTVELLFSLQTEKSDKLKCRVLQVLSVSKESVRILVRPEEMSRSLEDDIVNHLILDPSLNLEHIRHAGFRIKSVANNFRFRFLKTQEEYEEVLQLRYDAYAGNGKVMNDGIGAKSMVAPLDHLSRILVAYHGDSIIASVAMSFPESQDVILDTERALPSGYPDSFPPKVEMIEIARLCTNPNYRRGDLLLRMFEHIYKIFATSGRKYLISSTDKALWPIYKNLGFKKTGLKYAHPYLAGLEHDIIMIDILVPVTGAGIGFMRWWYLYSNMTAFVEGRKKLKRFGYARARYEAFRLLANLLNLGKKVLKR